MDVIKTWQTVIEIITFQQHNHNIWCIIRSKTLEFTQSSQLYKLPSITTSKKHLIITIITLQIHSTIRITFQKHSITAIISLHMFFIKTLQTDHCKTVIITFCYTNHNFTTSVMYSICLCIQCIYAFFQAAAIFNSAFGSFLVSLIIQRHNKGRRKETNRQTKKAKK